MKTIQVYDPPICCSTGICGTDIDPDLVNFAAMFSQLDTHGIKVKRYNLGQQPMAFVQNPADGNRLEVARSLGATKKVVNSSDEQAVDRIMALTNDAGVGVAIEAVSIPASFDICHSLIAPGGRIANVGVHGKPVEFHIERLWSSNITLTTRLVDTVTTPMLPRIVQSGCLDAKRLKRLVSHRFELSEIMKVYDTFGNAAKERALKVVLKNASASGGALKEKL
jgi:alcohol dehydrogenase